MKCPNNRWQLTSMYNTRTLDFISLLHLCFSYCGCQKLYLHNWNKPKLENMSSQSSSYQQRKLLNVQQVSLICQSGVRQSLPDTCDTSFWLLAWGTSWYRAFMFVKWVCRYGFMNYSTPACMGLHLICCINQHVCRYVSSLPDACMCLWTVFNLRKQLHCFSLFLHFTEHSPLMAVMENETWPHPSYVPHYLLRGDPFASRLSKEADIVAAFYICIIGQFPIVKNFFLIIFSSFHW